jgi:Fur family transcriptional regulator, ferric uptake regulator
VSETTHRRTRNSTRQGEVVAEVLNELTEFHSAQEIHAELKRRGEGVGLTTVYRHLNLLAEGGAVDVSRTPDGETIYRRCAVEAHHHHLICRSCGKTLEFEGPEVERWAETIAKKARFHEVSHTVEIFGICPDCFNR